MLAAGRPTLPAEIRMRGSGILLLCRAGLCWLPCAEHEDLLCCGEQCDSSSHLLPAAWVQGGRMPVGLQDNILDDAVRLVGACPAHA